MKKIAAITLLFACSFVMKMGAADGDERWDDQFFEAGSGFSTLKIESLAFTGEGTLLCGGNFFIPSAPGGNLFQWNGKAWSVFGGGVSGSQSNVSAIAIDGNYTYVGGRFNLIGGFAITNLARWNGSIWESIGGGISGGSVRSMIVTNGNVIIGGTFTNVGGLAVKGIAKWDGNMWTDFGGGIAASSPSEASPTVATLFLQGNELYAGGSFTNAGGVTATNIAKWNGSVWQSLGEGVENGVNGKVWKIGTDFTGLIVVGGEQLRPAISNIVLLAWDGTNWSRLGTGVAASSVGNVKAIEMYGTNLYVGGSFQYAGTNFVRGVARWDGSQWFPVSAPLQGEVQSMISDGQTLYVSGKLSGVMSPDYNGLVKFDGHSWSVIGNGISSSANPPKLAAISVTDSTVQVGGRFNGQPSNPQLTAEWNGTSWLRMDGLGSAVSSRVLALLNVENKTYAAGAFCCAHGVTVNGVAMWSGTNWTVLGDGLPATGRALESWGTEIFAGHDGGISRWDGINWTALAGPVGGVRAVLNLESNLYVGGSFQVDGVAGCNNIARWDGASWNSLASGVDGPVYALAAYGNTLYVGGKFTNASGVVVNRIAKWDGTNWAPMGAGFFQGVAISGSTNTFDVHAAVNALEIASDGTVYAAGNFTQAEIPGINFVAKWGGSAWLPLGSGANGPIYALGIKDGGLFIGGDFYRVAGRHAYSFCRWDLQEPFKISARFGQNELILSWPTNPIGFTLQSTVNLNSSSNWIDFTNAPVVVDGKFTITNTISENGQFYRLKK